MERSLNFKRELPAGYTLKKEIDAVGNKKLAVGLNLAGLGLMIAVYALTVFLRFGKLMPVGLFFDGSLSVRQVKGGLFGLVVAMLVYLILHELTHGAAYKLLTGEKLTFGIRLSCAYCGVPDIYVTRKTALISLLAPFTLFTLLFGVMIVLLPDFYAFLMAVLFSVHFGGCAGDLYDTLLLIFSLRGNILMRDTGPKQSFYAEE